MDLRYRCLGLLLVGGMLPRMAWGVVQASTPTVQGSTSTVVQESTTTAEAPGPDQTTSSLESESKGIIPLDVDILISTQPITPTSVFPEKKPYDQARDELIRALKLFNAGRPEAASDTALEAYEDFMQLRRVPGVKRATIRAHMRQAASIYVEAGIAYVNNYVKRMGGSPEIVQEGVSRLEDLRDVARNYSDLNKTLNNAIAQLSSGNVGPAK